ncbi:hypothetical protein [Emticicia sp. 21SJ11W-3]|uniref:hypothetical protein n=1 Tax=Emticicia sp. 21SJ11W-3 TaxID=2916755 RepID=UPI0020A0E562|nr:hypothetical protein [Emticicia sp. 21SJ11W-3]UTA66330.1 hypothetical protein MB380_12020 [Emticicia sp. 21SJ11W-3]
MTTAERISTLNALVIQMPINEQEALIKALKREVLIAKAKKLDNSVNANTLSIDEIVDEVRKARQQRNA